MAVLPAQAQELRALQLELLVVGLVDGHDHRRGRPPQDLRDLLVGGRQAGRRVDDEDDDVGLLDGQAGLVLDALLDGVAGVDLQAAGVDDDVAAVVPLGHAVEPVAGRAGAVLDDGPTLADDAVEERGLAHVGAAHDGHDGQAGERRVPVQAARAAARGAAARHVRRALSEVLR